MLYFPHMEKIVDIDPSKVKGGLHKYAGQYVVLDTSNKIVGSGSTYREATKKTSGRKDVALFSVPEADVVLIP